MGKKIIVASLALCVSALAQDSLAIHEAVSYTTNLRDRFRRLSTPVVKTYGIASLAALVCPVDKDRGAELYREAISSLNNLPLTLFRDSTSLLPAASFSGLFKQVLDAGEVCGNGIASPDDNARFRRESERQEASLYLAEAVAFRRDPDRSAQLAIAALEAGDPFELDITPLTNFLIKLRVRAPEIADDVFGRSLDFLLSARTPNVIEFADLGNYLFLDPRFLTGSEPILQRTNYLAGNSIVANWKAEHDNTNPDLVPLYIGAAADMLARPGVVQYEPGTAYALAYQLLPKARERQLDAAGTLKKIVDQIESQYEGPVSQVKAALGKSTGFPDVEEQTGRVLTQVRAAIAAGRFDTARDQIRSLDGIAGRSIIGNLIDFYQAGELLKKGNSARALSIAGSLPGGVKRALLYGAIAASPGAHLDALAALHMAIKDVELLSYEQRMAILPALAEAAQTLDSEEALGILSQTVKAFNDAATSPRKRVFSARDTNSFDGNRILLTSTGFIEVVQAAQRRPAFPLKVPHINTYSLTGFLSRARDLDFLRVAAAADGLRNELYSTNAYLALADLRLRIALGVK